MTLDHIADPKLAIIIAVLFARFKAVTYQLPFIGIAFNLIGTFLHEMAHFIVALLLNGRPVGFSLFPVRHGDEWMLGSVEVKNVTWYNAIPIAMAPLTLFVGAYYLDLWYISFLPIKTIWSDLGYIMALVVLIENAIPSMRDIQVASSNAIGIVFYISFSIFVFSNINITSPQW